MSECSGSCSSCSGNCGSCGEGPSKFDERMAAMKHKILVLSGKGGVGKSTVAASLAVTLAQKGYKVGLLDLDFHGPSQPTLFHLQNTQMVSDEEGICPAEACCGVRVLSIGLLIEKPDEAVIWRGPAKIGVLKQLFEEVSWGELDYMILDFPPGTGDEVLSACQMITGDKSAVVVTTPQGVSLADCRKCRDFCNKLEVKVAGIVENMSGFVCPDCGKRHDLFATGGGKKLSEAFHVPLLSQLPLEPAFLAACDRGDICGGIEKSTAIHDALNQVADAIIKN